MTFLFARGALKRLFCQAGEADIQNYASAQDVFPGNFLHTTYYYDKVVPTGIVQQPLFRY